MLIKSDWQIKKLVEVIKLEYGKPLPDDKRISNGKYPVYGANGEKDRTDEYYYDKQSIIVGRKGSAGEINLTEKKFWPLDVTYFVTFDDKKYDLKFLYNLLDTLELPKLAKGVKPGINRNEVYSIQVKVPSLPTQLRIVKILDRVFEKTAKAKEIAEKNLQNSRELFESYLQSVFANLGDEWEEKKLGEVCKIIGGGTPSKANSKFYNGDIYWATVRDMKGEIVKDTEHRITNDAVKNSSTNIIPKGNVIIATRVGLGKVCLIENDTAINQDLRGVVPIKSNVLSVIFLYRWFKSIAHLIVEEGTGATVQGVKLPFIKSLLIPIPPLKEQQAIVNKLDFLNEEIKKLVAIYQQKLADLEELKKSILQKAFNGEFVGACS